MKTPSPANAHPRHHAVQFYDSETSLYTTVAGFLGQGLVDGQPAIVIATESHRDAILEHMKGRLIDVDEAQRFGDLVTLDARQTLSLFMVDDMPDAELFDSSVGRLITDLLRMRSKHTMIRAYGEMVDVLWKEGKAEAAIRLEMLWNKLAATYGFALLCGYAMGSFYKETLRFEEVCRQHTHVIPAAADVPAPAAGTVQ
jgi:KaiC/GvpD/RAD55 family RecA-like ATPase